VRTCHGPRARTGARRSALIETGLVAAAALVLVAAFAPRADAYVYWANNAIGSDSIGRANNDGSAVDQDFITGADNPAGVAVDAGHVYWPNLVANGSGTTVGRANIDGSGADQDFITGAAGPNAIAVDGAHVYWSNVDVASQSIGRANLDGSAADQSFITGQVPSGVAVDADHVYWTNFGSDSIGRADLDGSDVDQSFITGLDNPIGVAVDAVHIYWADTGAVDAIGRADLDGTDAVQSFVDASSPCGVAVDGAHLYWGNPGVDAVGRADLDGTDADQTFIAGEQPCGVAVDGGPVAPPVEPPVVEPPLPPTCHDISAATVHGQAIAVTLDCAGTARVHEIASGPHGGQISNLDPAAGTFTYTPTIGFFGRDSLGFDAVNAGGRSNAATATIDVAPASNAFSLGKAKRKKRKGTARLAVIVPGAGTIELRGSKKLKGARATASGAGKLKLRVKPRGKTKRKLLTRGRAKVRAKVSFAPVGGYPASASKRIKLVRHRRH
jgi:virginiamycin B lyase